MLAELGPARNGAPQRMISRSRVLANGHGALATSSEDRLTIQMATLDDASAIAELANVVFRGRERSLGVGFANPTDIEELINQGKFILAERQKEIVGCAYLKPLLEASSLELLAVTPSRQRAGIGSQLLEAAERLSSSMQCLFIHVRVLNLHWEALRFCRRRGYREFGIESLGAQPVSPHCHFVRMCKRLEADCLAF